MARCPNCHAPVESNAEQCAKCSALFTEGGPGWRPVPDSPEEAALMPPEERYELPFAKRWPVLAGALVGVLLRLAFFGNPGGPYAAMMGSFIFLAPVLVGATTVYLAERHRRRSWGYYIWAPFMANVFFVLGTLIIMVEGLICAVLIVPVFAVIGIVGGLIMGIVCRVTQWPRHALYGFALLPLVLGGVEGNVATPTRVGAVERTTVVRAQPETVWWHLMNARDIKPEEMERAWIYRIGVPLPLSAMEDGPVRKIRMGKNIHFDQVFTQRVENRSARWTYRMYPDSFPPYALDDHVLVGGYYFDVRDTSYTLMPVAEGTEVRVSMGYRVTTQFNWYAEPLARLLLGNFEEVALDFYRRRSERP